MSMNQTDVTSTPTRCFKLRSISGGRFFLTPVVRERVAIEAIDDIAQGRIELLRLEQSSGLRFGFEFLERWFPLLIDHEFLIFRPGAIHFGGGLCQPGAKCATLTWSAK